MRRTVTKAPMAMTGPRAKGATASLARAWTEGEAATRDMGPIHAPSRSAEQRQAQFRLARTAAGPLIADNYTVEEQLAPPYAPRFAAVESIGQAGGPGRAVLAQCLRTGHVAGRFSEEQVRIGT